MKNIRTNIFNLSTVKLPVTQGSILVSEPFLAEQYFKHAAIAMIDVTESEGAMGVVLNNRTDYMLSDLIENVDSQRSIPVYCGGPVSLDRLYFIHTLGANIISDAAEFAEGLWVGGDFDSVIEYVNSGYRTNGVLRFFLGYSGWTPGQLEEELNNNVWAVAQNPPAASTLLSTDGDRLWHNVVRTMGTPYRQWQLHPINPHAN